MGGVANISTFVLTLDDAKVNVTLCAGCGGNLSLFFPEPIATKSCTLEGECSIQNFPVLHPSDAAAEPRAPTADEHALIERVFLELASINPAMQIRVRATGASAPLALLITDTDAAVQLALRMYEREPDLLLHQFEHENFEGETALHVLAANSRHAALKSALESAAEGLQPRQLAVLRRAHCTGDFVWRPPVCFLGGTFVSIAAVTGAKEVLQMLATDRRFADAQVSPGKYAIDFNRNRGAISGFLPIHAVVAFGLADMYDFLLRLPPVRGERVDANARTDPNEKLTDDDEEEGFVDVLTSSRVSGMLRRSQLEGKLTPLQLAVWFGDKRMFKHIARSMVSKCGATRAPLQPSSARRGRAVPAHLHG
jgi:hypothetical protein